MFAKNINPKLERKLRPNYYVYCVVSSTRAQTRSKYSAHGGPAVCVRFDECDATRQQRTSTVLFIEAFRAGLAACGWASDASMPPAASRLQTGKAGATGLRSLLTPPLWGPVRRSRAFVCRSQLPHRVGSCEYCRQLHPGEPDSFAAFTIV